MVVPVWPFDQLTVQPAQTFEALRVTLWPAHKLVGPDALSVGAEGATPLVTAMALEAGLVPQALFSVAV